jgi:hypothetical protein
MKSTPSPKPSDSKIKAYYICGTHWDREWYEPFHGCEKGSVIHFDIFLERALAKDLQFPA